eukprot:9094596-Pyramimonas_sp.AAC.1
MREGYRLLVACNKSVDPLKRARCFIRHDASSRTCSSCARTAVARARLQLASTSYAQALSCQLRTHGSGEGAVAVAFLRLVVGLALVVQQRRSPQQLGQPRQLRHRRVRQTERLHAGGKLLARARQVPLRQHLAQLQERARSITR